MKTLKKEGNYIRVTDKEADERLKYGWSFCPKSEWKTNVRDFGKESKAERKKKEEKV
jgi:hypothetical protein